MTYPHMMKGSIYRLTRKLPLIAGLASLMLLSSVGGQSLQSVAQANDQVEFQTCPVSEPNWQPDTINYLVLSDPDLGHVGPIRSVAFSPDGNYLASGGADGTVKLWTLYPTEDNEFLLGSYQASDDVTSVTFSPNGRYLISGSLNGVVNVWDLDTGNIQYEFTNHADNLTTSFPAGIATVTFSPDGLLVTAGTDDRTVRFWDLETGILASEIVSTQDIKSISFSADGQYLAITGLGMEVEVWDLLDEDEDEPIATLMSNARPIYAVAFHPCQPGVLAYSPDSVSTSTDIAEENTIRFWDMEGEELGEPLQGHVEEIISLTFSPGGRYLMSGSWDDTFRIWDIANRQTVYTSTEFTEIERVLSVAFSQDGQAFAIGSNDNVIYVGYPSR